MPSDLQITNIKDQANANSAITIASDGQITVNQNNPTVTLGSNASINTQDYFHVKLSSSQTISDSANTAIAFANESTEGGDPNNWFNTTTYKFQPTKAGKYHVSLSIGAYSHSAYYLRILNVRVKKNSTALDDTNEICQIKFDARDSSSSTQYWYSLGGTGSALVNMNGSSDYIYCIAYGNIGSGSGVVLEENITHFSGFRIGS
tara:strand:+ start:15456 stop:16067 length:612 start_codon:yes stop_codon:yes gene_type:complete